jgi:hypothetical protein
MIDGSNLWVVCTHLLPSIAAAVRASLLQSSSCCLPGAWHASALTIKTEADSLHLPCAAAQPSSLPPTQRSTPR